MKYKDFSQQIWEQIEENVFTFVKKNPGRHFAAFDADGTLWDTDMGEIFFDFQIKESSLKSLPPDPWTHYQNWKEHDPRGAYLWLAQINESQSLEQVHHWAIECYRQHQSQIPAFQPQQKLIEKLHSYGVEVFVVTASVKWAVEPAAKKIYNIDYDHVIGIETEMNAQGILTSVQKGPITWREGKATGLLAKTQGAFPLLTSGNTLGDQHLIELGQKIKLAVRANPPGTELFANEEQLFKMAQQCGWLTHSFV